MTTDAATPEPSAPADPWEDHSKERSRLTQAHRRWLPAKLALVLVLLAVSAASGLIPLAKKPRLDLTCLTTHST